MIVTKFGVDSICEELGRRIEERELELAQLKAELAAARSRAVETVQEAPGNARLREAWKPSPKTLRRYPLARP